MFLKVCFSIAQESRPEEKPTIPLEQFVGYYYVGVKPNKPFFKSRWYIKDEQLYVIYDSDRDRKLEPYKNGKLKPTIFLSEEDVQITEKDSTYYLVLNFENEKLESFKVIRPGSKLPTDLYGYRNDKLNELAVDTESSLIYHYATAHFNFYYSALDSDLIPQLGNHPGKKYYDLMRAFNLDSISTTNIRIYPGSAIYHNAVLSPGAPSWQRGRAWTKNEIRMVSPIIAQRETRENIQINNMVLHEFIHCLHLNLVKNGTRVPGWLWEGLAMYKGCCRWTTSPKELDYIKNKKYPSLRQIQNDRSYQMKYDLGYYLVEFLDQKYEWTNVLKLINKNGDIKKALNISVKDFQEEFYRYLEAKY
ncbi:hypothetical protein FNH22_25325 [Fulvivirga sp. M361]|uniref:hypothetical protein n=1 Tax=Fulvivirga sp. M361 TaxID=2594266 RepID=UPI00117BBDE0|nr:hypothetical protein [Fulvivirga sp. M361]TRX50646.1 hypothetical protein FNH22_25325 [Fulvivirga sp. M361]